MSWLPQFSSAYFAMAGLLFAAGPVLIHFLNRRRYRLLHWAAMDFLQEAVRRQRRRLELRNLLLLLLRTLALLCFGLALARPYFRNEAIAIGIAQPRHLILLIDNSLSMAYRPVSNTQLDEAKQGAAKLIDDLPAGSRISIVPTCGGPKGRDPARDKKEARQRLAAIEIADGVATRDRSIAQIRELPESPETLPQQVVYFTDLQQLNWPSATPASPDIDISGVDVRDMSIADWQNSWISDVRLSENIIDSSTDLTVAVEVQHHGARERQTAVTLKINGNIVSSQLVKLPAGRSQRQVALTCPFPDTEIDSAGIAFVTIEASLAHDRLAEDDRRGIVVPVAEALPIMLIDMIPSAAEDTVVQRFGETRPLRQLIAVSGQQRQLMAVTHCTPQQVTRARLANMHCVVIAGVADPGPLVSMLEEYVAQGGQLVIAAGGAFDAAAWNQHASRLLPGSLAPSPWGEAPADARTETLRAAKIDDSHISSSSIVRLPRLNEREFADLLAEPLFFKCLQVDISTAPSGLPDGVDQPAMRWLQWSAPTVTDVAGNQAKRTPAAAPQVCLQLDNPPGLPLLIQHRVGRGQVLLFTSSLLPTWNNLAQTNAIVLWDHMLRYLLASTTPQRNFRPQDRVLVPLTDDLSGGSVSVRFPDSTTKPQLLQPFVFANREYGVTIPAAWVRGFYQLEAVAQNGAKEVPRTIATIALNGDPRESDLSAISQNQLQQLTSVDQVDQMTATAKTHGHWLWWWLIGSVILLLIAEMLLLALTTNRSTKNFPIATNGR